MVPEPQEEGEWELERGRGMDIYGSEGVNQERDSMRPVSAQLIESKNLSLVSPRNKLISLCSFSSRQKANFCYSESEPWSGAGVGMNTRCEGRNGRGHPPFPAGRQRRWLFHGSVSAYLTSKHIT